MFKKALLTFTLFLSPVLVLSPVLAADPTFTHVIAATPDGTGQFGRLNLQDGSFFLIRNYDQPYWGITRYHDGVYVVDGNGIVFKLDPDTGTPTKIGATGVPATGPSMVSFYAAGALANGDFFGLDQNANLWKISLDDGSAKLIGNTGLMPINSERYGESLAGDDKSLYVTLEIAQPLPGPALPDLVEPTLYRIDPATAQATKIASAPPLSGGSTLVNGKLYLFTIQLDDDGFPDGNGPTLEVNLQTAEAKPLAIPAPCMGGGYGGFPIPAPPPQVSASLRVPRFAKGCARSSSDPERAR